MQFVLIIDVGHDAYKKGSNRDAERSWTILTTTLKTLSPFYMVPFREFQCKFALNNELVVDSAWKRR